MTFLNACQAGVEDQYGYLTIGVSNDLNDKVVMKSDDETSEDVEESESPEELPEVEEEEIVYEIEVYDENGNMDAYVQDHTQISVESPIQLLIGKYNVVAISGTRGTGFNIPYFKGEKSVRIWAEKGASVDIKCKMAKVKFSVEFPEDESFAANFPICQLLVSNGEVLTFTSKPDLNDPKQGSFDDVAYFEVPANNKLSYTLQLQNAHGAMYSFGGELTSVKEAEHYHFKFEMGQKENIDGALVLDVMLNGVFKESVEHDLRLNFDKTFMPTYETNVEFDPSVKDLVYPLGEGGLKKIYFNIPRGVRSLAVTHLDRNLLECGIPQLINFIGISEHDKGVANSIGLVASDVKSGDVTAEIDLTEFVKNLPMSPENEPYSISFTAVDLYDRYVRCDFQFSIVSDYKAVTLDATPWSSFATLRGRYFTKAVPEGMTFQYRKKDVETWTEIDPDLITVDQITSTYSYRLNHLELNTEYVFRATTDADKAAAKEALPIEFSTVGTEGVIHNLSLDAWYKDGKAWFPNENSSNFVWDSANGGTADIMGQSLVPTTPEDNIVIKGRAARMESGELLNNFAAGNIYTGKFGKATISPIGATLDWGVPFSSRPLALRGWYRYEPQAINRAKGAYEGLMGQTDRCQIQMFLTNWSSPFGISTGDNRFVNTSLDNPEIIAYGSIISSENTTQMVGNVNGYIQFVIPLEYVSSEIPSYVVVSAAASRYGDYFTGGLGSTLYLDELEFIYDPDQLTPEQYDIVMRGIR
jgi:hypothetical protein